MRRHNLLYHNILELRHFARLALAAAVLLAPAAGRAASQITRAVVGAGGGTAAGVTASVRATVGQPAVGGADGATIRIGAGWWLQAPGAATGVPDDLPLPLVFRAYPNHPNPFNPRTTIEYVLPVAAPVRIGVYDAAGRCVAAFPVVEGQRSVRVRFTGLMSGSYFVVFPRGSDTPPVRFTFVR